MITIEGVLGSLALLTLMICTYTDLHWRIVPNKIVLPGLALALAGLPFTADWSSRLWAVGFVALLYTLRGILSSWPAGMGDAKLLLLLALTLGLPALLSSLSVMCVLALAFFGVQIGRGKLTRSDPIPLVPFMALGVGIVAIEQAVWVALYSQWLW